MALDFKKKLIRIIGLYFLIVLLLLIVNFWLRYDINRQVKTIQNSRKQIFSYQNSLENTSILKSGSEKIKNEKLFLESILPQSDNLSNFEKDLSILARQFNLEASFRTGSEVKGDEVVPGQVNFSLIAVGRLGDLLNFLRALESIRYIISFSSYNINGVEEGKFNLNLDGKVFSQ